MATFDMAALVKGLTLLHNEVEDIEKEQIPDSPNIWWKLTHLEPALYAGAVVAVVALIATFGFIVSGKTSDSIVSLVTIVISLVQAFWTRTKSTANSKVVVYKPDPVAQPTQVLAGAAVSSNALAVVNAAAVTPGTPSAILPLIP